MKKYQFFEHKDCEFYPCHHLDQINCLFCYCPAYPYEKCPGQAKWLKNGIKDCSDCHFPHKVENYDKMIQFLIQITQKE